MSYSPDVTVVMPAFNAIATIETAVRSVLEQSVVSIELIVCDDASTDETLNVLNKYSDKRLHVVTNNKNLGPGVSRDRAIARSRAPWIALIDADDAWEPDRLEKMLQALGEDTDVLIFDDITICHDVDGQMVPWRMLHGNRAFGTSGTFARDVRLEDYIRSERLLVQPMMPAHIIRQHQLRHSKRRFAEDAEFFIRVALAGARLRYLPEPLYLYRVTPGSATATARDPSLMRQCMEDCASMDGLSESVRRAFAEKIASLRLNETLYDLAARCRRRDLGGTIRLLVQNPGLLRILPRRLSRHLVYQLHRVLRGGRSR